MIQPDKPTAAPDDADLDEPIDDAERESSLLDEEAFLPDDDSDLGLDSEDRVIGLDVDTGLDGALDSELGDDEDEESWLDEDAIDTVLTGEDDGDDEEDDDEGGADDTEPARGTADDWENESPFEEDGTPIGDSGEEGFGEDVSVAEIDLPRLPPLDDSLSVDAEERESDALTAELLAELTARIDADERLEELAPGLRCTRMPASQVVLDMLLRPGRPLTALAASGDAGLGWDGSLLVSAAAGSPRPERRFAGPDALLALAVLQTDSALLVALATPTGLLCSRDGGRTFDAVAAAPALRAHDWLASSIAWTQTARGPRLWAAAPDGALCFSDDLGATLQVSSVHKGVLRLHSDGGHNLVGLQRDRNPVEGAPDRAQALRSSDGGASFDTLALPVSEVERVQDVQSLGRVLLCCRRAPSPQLVWRTNAATDWQELSPFSCAPAVLVLEDEQVCAYFVVQHAQRSWLMRRVLAAHAPAAQIVADIPADAGMALQLVAGQHGGVTLLHLGTERAWYRIRVQLAGDAT
jgi:hypothetical protein